VFEGRETGEERRETLKSRESLMGIVKIKCSGAR
jgi:hypothetical protein